MTEETYKTLTYQDIRNTYTFLEFVIPKDEKTLASQECVDFFINIVDDDGFILNEVVAGNGKLALFDALGGYPANHVLKRVDGHEGVYETSYPANDSADQKVVLRLDFSKEAEGKPVVLTHKFPHKEETLTREFKFVP